MFTIRRTEVIFTNLQKTTSDQMQSLKVEKVPVRLNKRGKEEQDDRS